MLDNKTKISLASLQVAIEQYFFTILQILRGETSNSRFLNVKAKVTAIDETRVVGTYPQNETKRSVQIADTAGEIELILWRECVEFIAFEDGNVLNLENIVVSKFNGKLNLTTAFKSSIMVVDEEMTVARPAKHPLPKSNIISIEASVRATKEFISTFSFMGCRKQLDLTDVQGVGGLISCPTCCPEVFNSVE